MRGFSLVEIMVGMVIGLLGTIVIFQVFAASEGYKRTTTAGGDATQNGAAALFAIERDLRVGGHGINNSEALACTNSFTYFDSGGGAPGPIPGFATRPLVIQDGGAGPDSFTVNYTSSVRGNVAAELASPGMGSAAGNLKVNTTFGFANDDLVLVTSGANCTLMTLTNVDDAALELAHAAGSAPTHNPSATYMAANAWPAYPEGAKIYNVGQRFFSRTYSLNGSTLRSQDANGAAVAPIAADIVSMQAQYGIAPAGSQVVGNWVDATGGWAAPTPADVQRIKAVRLAIVARSPLSERPSIAGGACDTTAAAPVSWIGGPALDLSADANWSCYRYKVFQTIVPLRNIIWANLP